MKKLALIATIFISLGLLCVLVPSLVFAQITWDSYNDALHANQSDSFTDLHCTVYMYGEGFGKKVEYKIVYWDGEDNKRIVELLETPANLPFKLSSEHTFDVPDVPGDWHCTVYFPNTYIPTSYDPDDSNIVADDISYSGCAFNVAESAIPEFPTVMVGIGVAGLCFGIYYWMRKRIYHIPT